jgi:hypothetical protein
MRLNRGISGFRGLKKTGTCVPRQKCYGIACLVRELGGTDEFAENYARWVWRRQIMNKFRDSSLDSPKTVSGRIKRGLIRILTPLFEIRGDPYQLEDSLHQIELQINQMEQEWL